MVWAMAFMILLVSWFTPWWIYLVIAALFGWQASSPMRSFASGFMGAGLAWVLAAYYQDMQTSGLISQRLSKMFALPQSLLIYPVLWIVAGVSAGLFCMAGYYLCQLRPVKRLSAPE